LLVRIRRLLAGGRLDLQRRKRFGEGRPPVREVVAYWPALIPRELIETRVEVIP